ASALAAEGLSAHALAADLGAQRDFYAIAGAAAALVGPIDVLVHNASSLGPFRLSKAIVGNMLLRGQGLVVHVSSDAATSAYPRWGAYGVSKAALDHLARIWAAELEGTGVRFLAVDPGEMDTAMHAAAMPGADPRTLSDPADVAR